MTLSMGGSSLSRVESKLDYSAQVWWPSFQGLFPFRGAGSEQESSNQYSVHPESLHRFPQELHATSYSTGSRSEPTAWNVFCSTRRPEPHNYYSRLSGCIREAAAGPFGHTAGEEACITCYRA